MSKEHSKITKVPGKKKKRRPQLTDFEKGQIVTLHSTGMSTHQIGKKMRRSQPCIHKFLKRYRATKEYSRRPGSGRKRKTTAREDRYNVRQALKKRRISAGKNLNILEALKSFK
jgi:IS30 family transposase